MFAHGGIGRLQRGQNDRGEAIEISRGTRYAATLTKLPTHAPNMNAKSAASPRGISINESTPPLLIPHQLRERTLPQPSLATASLLLRRAWFYHFAMARSSNGRYFWQRGQ